MARGEHFTFKSLADLRRRISELGLGEKIGLVEDVGPAVKGRMISSPAAFGPFRLGNRFVAHPMEGWDGDPHTGRPTDDVIRRWNRVATSGVALAWGMEAMAVDSAYRANPCELVLTPDNTGAFEQALLGMRRAHADAFGGDSRLNIGAQLTCSGRYSFAARPRLLVHHHPALDEKVGADKDAPLLSDMQLEEIAGKYGRAARTARDAGFDFVDIKACHGYWLNETLAAKTRPGRYGGNFENRIRIFMMAVDAVRREVGDDFPLGTRLSVFDGLPFEEDKAAAASGARGPGRPCAHDVPYLWGWGVNERNPFVPDLEEPCRFVGLALKRGIAMFNLTAGNPYANPHVSRPTESPPVDAYRPPRDPLNEVALHLWMAAEVKRIHPAACIVGTGYSYLRQFKVHAAEHSLRAKWTDAVGLGRAMLSYPDEARELIAKGEAKPDKGRIICTGDSTCTTGPRLGLRSGCIYDPHYASTNREIAAKLKSMGLKK